MVSIALKMFRESLQGDGIKEVVKIGENNADEFGNVS